MKVQKELHETCCFTGHRKLEMPVRELEKKTSELIQKAISQGYTHFICGGALGFDMLAAEEVVTLRTIYSHGATRKPITLEIAVPCADQTAKWSQKQQARYEAILECADAVNTLSKQYSRQAMSLRNKYMVSKSSLVIAYYIPDNTGGTKNTLAYAEKQGREIWHVNKQS